MRIDVCAQQFCSARHCSQKKNWTTRRLERSVDRSRRTDSIACGSLRASAAGHSFHFCPCRSRRASNKTKSSSHHALVSQKRLKLERASALVLLRKLSAASRRKGIFDWLTCV